jgi:hypothetical protein
MVVGAYSQVSHFEFEFWFHHSLAVLLWETVLNSLSFNFLICKMGVNSYKVQMRLDIENI